ncbi:MAG: hypothetical protein ACLUT5_14370 [Butyricicoccus sp.]
MNGNKKLLYIASSFGHLASFHQPYTEWLAQQGYEVHAAAGGEQRALRGVSRYIPLPFEKACSRRATLRQSCSSAPAAA